MEKKDYNQYTVKELKQMVKDRKIIHWGLKKADYVKSLEDDDEGESLKKIPLFDFFGITKKIDELEKSHSQFEKSKTVFFEKGNNCLQKAIKKNQELDELQTKTEITFEDYQQIIAILKWKLWACHLFAASPLKIPDLMDELGKYGKKE